MLNFIYKSSVSFNQSNCLRRSFLPWVNWIQSLVVEFRVKKKGSSTLIRSLLDRGTICLTHLLQPLFDTFFIGIFQNTLHSIMWTILALTVSRRGEAGTPTKFVATAGVGNDKRAIKKICAQFYGACSKTCK